MVYLPKAAKIVLSQMALLVWVSQSWVVFVVVHLLGLPKAVLA